MDLNVKLDKKYCCTKNSTKSEILNIINSFINQNPLFCPKSINCSCGVIMKKFCDENGYVILDEYFLASKIPQKLRSSGFYSPGNNDIAIVSDSDKCKKILVKRGTGKVKEISASLSIDTLYCIWDTFVNKVKSYQYSLRKLKELKYDIETINFNPDILYCLDNEISDTKTILSLVSLVNVTMNIYNRSVTFKRSIYKYNQKESKFYLDSSSENINLSLPTFNEMVISYKKKPTIRLLDLKEMMKNRYSDNIKNYDNNFNESMTFINSLINN